MNIIHDAISLSDGTLAVLTGKRSFEELDAIQTGFVAFVSSHAGQFDTWMQAWNAFTAQPQVAADYILNRKVHHDGE